MKPLVDVLRKESEDRERRLHASFDEWYAEWDDHLLVSERLEEELPEPLMEATPYYDADPEVFSLDLAEHTVGESTKMGGGTTEYVVRETWNFSVSFTLGGDERIGGKDGIDVHASGHGEAEGVAKVIHRFVKKDDGELVDESVEIEEIDVHYEDHWDPRQAWLRTL